MNTNPHHYQNADETGHDAESREVALGDVSKVIGTGELDKQIETAKRYPRSLTGFRDEAMNIVRLTPSIAEQCTYILPARRGSEDKKPIDGASVRFAEIILSCWGNIRSAARSLPVKPDDEYVIGEGICYDLQRNSAFRFETLRRIVNKEGVRYGHDMIATTANAAASIAVRNAILKTIPRAYWDDIHEAAKATARGDVVSLAARREKVLLAFKAISIPPDVIYAYLEIKGLEDVTLDHIMTLGGIMNAISDGDTTAEGVFGYLMKASGGLRPPRPGAKASEFSRPPTPAAKPDTKASGPIIDVPAVAESAHALAAKVAPQAAPPPKQQAPEPKPQTQTVDDPYGYWPQHGDEPAPAKKEAAPSGDDPPRADQKEQEGGSIEDDLRAWFGERMAEIDGCTPAQVLDLFDVVAPQVGADEIVEFCTKAFGAAKTIRDATDLRRRFQAVAPKESLGALTAAMQARQRVILDTIGPKPKPEK